MMAFEEGLPARRDCRLPTGPNEVVEPATMNITTIPAHRGNNRYRKKVRALCSKRSNSFAVCTLLQKCWSFPAILCFVPPHPSSGYQYSQSRINGARIRVIYTEVG